MQGTKRSIAQSVIFFIYYFYFIKKCFYNLFYPFSFLLLVFFLVLKEIKFVIEKVHKNLKESHTYCSYPCLLINIGVNYFYISPLMIKTLILLICFFSFFFYFNISFYKATWVCFVLFCFKKRQSVILFTIALFKRVFIYFYLFIYIYIFLYIYIYLYIEKLYICFFFMYFFMYLLTD
jgi:hypothetical protein